MSGHIINHHVKTNSSYDVKVTTDVKDSTLSIEKAIQDRILGVTKPTPKKKHSVKTKRVLIDVELLEDAMKERGLMKKDVEAGSGVRVSMLSFALRGADINIKYARKLAKFLKLKISDLVIEHVSKD